PGCRRELPKMPCRTGLDPVTSDAHAGAELNGTLLSTVAVAAAGRSEAMFGSRPCSRSRSTICHEPPSNPTTIVRRPRAWLTDQPLGTPNRTSVRTDACSPFLPTRPTTNPRPILQAAAALRAAVLEPLLPENLAANPRDGQISSDLTNSLVCV